MAINQVIEIDVDTLKAMGGIDNLDKSIKQLDKDTNHLNQTFEDVYGELQPLTSRMGELEDRMYELALAGKSNTQEFKDLEAQVGKYKRTMQETDRAVDAAAMTTAGKMTGAIQGAANAFAIGESSAALFGVESENLQATMVKLQAAMALSQGVQGLRESANVFTQIGKSAKTALSGIKTGIAATGIGILVIALGAIVAYWDDITSLVNGVSREQEALNEKSQINVDLEKEKLNAIGGQENILKLQGKSEKDILKIKMAQTDQIIKASEIQIQNTIATTKAQEAAAQRNKEILKGILDFLSIPFKVVLKTIDTIGKAVGKNFGLAEGFSSILDKGADLIFSPSSVAKKGEETLKAQQDALNKLKNDRAGFELSIQNIDKQASDKAKAEEQKRADEAKAIRDKAHEEHLKDLEKQKEDLDNFKKITKEAADAEFAKKIEDEEAEKIRVQKSLEDTAKMFETLDADEKQRAENLAAAKKAIAEAETAHRVALFNKTSSILAQGADLLGKNTAAGKAMAVAASMINTYQGITAELATKTTTPFEIGLKIANVAIIAATGFKAVKDIVSVKVPGGGGGSTPAISGMAGMATAAAPQFNVIGNSGVNQIASTLGSQQPVQTYVVANQVTTQQALDRSIVNNASL